MASFFQNTTSPAVANLSWPRPGPKRRRLSLVVAIRMLLRERQEGPLKHPQHQASQAPRPPAACTGSGGQSARPSGVLRPWAAHFLCDPAGGRSRACGCSGKRIPEASLLYSETRGDQVSSHEGTEGPWPILAPNCPGRARPEVPPSPRQPPHHPTHARPAVSSSQGLPRGEATPAPPAPCHPMELAVPCSTYRLRTSSGSEMAREASVGTRAGAVRAGISEAAAEVSAARAALAFRAETNREGL